MKFEDNQAQQPNIEEISLMKTDPIVDEVNKTVIHYHKKDRKHIGQ